MLSLVPQERIQVDSCANCESVCFHTLRERVKFVRLVSPESLSERIGDQTSCTSQQLSGFERACRGWDVVSSGTNQMDHRANRKRASNSSEVVPRMWPSGGI